MAMEKRKFPSVEYCDPTGRKGHAVAADLDGTLLVSRSSFPYFMLLAVEAGGILRGLLLLLVSPIILFLYRLVSEAAGIQLLIFVSVAGLRVRDIELAAQEVLPRFYAADVRADSWRVFRPCGRRRVVVTANPTVMVEPFVKQWLGGDRVLGTKLQEDPWTGRATGFVSGAGVLVGRRKREAVEVEFAGEGLPELGLGDRESDQDFMSLCKEGYMVHPNRSAAKVPLDELDSRAILHDGRFVRRPEPHVAFSTFLWLPIGLALSVFRVLITLLLPSHLVRQSYSLCGIRLVVRGTPPPPPGPDAKGTLFVCNHRTVLDAVVLGVALGRKVSCVTHNFSTFSGILSPSPAVRRSVGRATDAATIAEMLTKGDVVVFPEGATCREPFLLRFTALFADLSDRIVPVAINTWEGMFHATTVRGYKFLDPYFFYMNPSPAYEITFLARLPEAWTRRGGRAAVDVANHVQRVLATELRFEATSLTDNGE